MMRAILIGKSKEMYVALWRFLFRNAALQGLDPPIRQGSGIDAAALEVPTPPGDDAGGDGSSTAANEPAAASALRLDAAPPGRQLRARVPLVAVLLDFETAEHDGAFEAMALEFGGVKEDYYGRAIGCRVHLCRFLLKKCGNDRKDPFYRAVLALRDSPPLGGLAAVREALEVLADRANGAGEMQKVELIKWMLNNGSALRAAFPLSAGALTRTEIMAAGESTNAAESLNRQTQLEVKERGTRTLLGVIKTLMEFDSAVMSEVLPSGPAFSVGGVSERARLVRSLARRKRNVIPAGGAPPKSSPRKKSKSSRAANGVGAAAASRKATVVAGSALMANGSSPATAAANGRVPPPSAATSSVPASSAPLPQVGQPSQVSSPALLPSQQAFMNSMQLQAAQAPGGPFAWSHPLPYHSHGGWPPVVGRGAVPPYPPSAGYAWTFSPTSTPGSYDTQK